MPPITPLPDRPALRQAITALTRQPEPELLPGLIAQAQLTPAQHSAAQALALRIAGGVRERQRSAGRSAWVQGLLQEFALSSHEGVALMCLAEALLRIPDAATRDALIRDKIAHGNWQQHLGHSPSLFVNAAAWGLLLTGKLVATHSDSGLGATLRRSLARGGEPLIRRGVDLAMRMMGEQFVTGETIAQALTNSITREEQGFRYSYDMLGEAALTDADALRYLAAYETAIHAIGAASGERGIVEGPGISIKLSALHPRYSRAQTARVRDQLYPRLLQLVRLAQRYDIGLNIDAEEADRLELSLDLLERLCFEPELATFQGIGFVIQAYQKRCPAVVDFLVDLARRSGHRLMIRLVKGAYWDSEIKRAQQDGLAGYPVYTRKAYTDVAYIACARKLLDASDAVYPQFATHNAHTLAAVQALAAARVPSSVGAANTGAAATAAAAYEFQCLHGMGEPLYEQVVGPVAEGGLGRPCRIYAPVGSHETLLAYLVRRLLENGANSSFVNRISDESLSLAELVRDPVDSVREMAAREGQIGLPHAMIAAPRDMFASAGQGDGRRNSSGLDLSDERTLAALQQALTEGQERGWQAEPLLAAAVAVDVPGAQRTRSEPSLPADPAGALAASPWQPIRNPADHSDIVGQVREATAADIHTALAAAVQAAPAWAATSATQRAAVLEAAADALQADHAALLPLLVREAGKTWASASAELREAIDFLRYDAQHIRRDFDNATHRPLGRVLCISPWNFPLAIFIGQVAAALAAGNAVLAKPAEQTPLLAAAAVRALHAAGVPRGALQLLPGRGDIVGAALVADARVDGVMFTGSTEVARSLQRTLATRLNQHGQPVPLIAETGGQNALIVDSSALLEQAVADILASAFDSAGQRCSALRLLCVQDDVAERLIALLQGGMRELGLGDPRALGTDVGPVIDAEAREGIERHVQTMAARGHRVWRAVTADPAPGHFVAPTLIEIMHVSDLGREVFGPVLHLLRYQREQLRQLLEQINATGYGLTLGVHTRIDETVAQVVAAARAGNLYVNRNIVGAVVGVQPFGGEGLSGTGPKAGGPLSLLRLLAQRPLQAARVALAHSGNPAEPPVRGLGAAQPAADGYQTTAASRPELARLRGWALQQGLGLLAAQCDQAAAESPVGPWFALPGPTGEANFYTVQPRERVLCLAGAGAGGGGGGDGDGDGSDTDRLTQLAAVLAVGSQALWPATARALRQRLPAELRERIALADDWTAPGVFFDAALQHATPADLLVTLAALADREGPIVGLIGLSPGEPRVPLETLLIERSLSINTAAAGGNASLMTLG